MQFFFQTHVLIAQKKNKTNNDRRILYYTYSLKNNGSKYNEYFNDKQKSKNPFKALNSKNENK